MPLLLRVKVRYLSRQNHGPMMWILAALLTFYPPAPAPQGTLRVVVRNIASYEGQLLLALYREDARWLEEEGRFREKAVRLHDDGPGEIRFEELPYGIYGLAIFHDLNANAELDKNWLGVPVEPYSFSGSPASRWRKPRFEEASFTFREDGQEVSIELKRWIDR